MIKQLFQIALLVTISVGLVACGETGSLYFPKKEQEALNAKQAQEKAQEKAELQAREKAHYQSQTKDVKAYQ